MKTTTLALLATLVLAPDPAQTQERTPTTNMVLSGFVMGGASYAVGAWGGRAVGRRVSDTERAQEAGELVFAVLGGSTGVVAGVRLANDGSGELGKEWLASTAIGTVGAGAVIAMSRLVPAAQKSGSGWNRLARVTYLAVIPAAQIAAVIHFERQAEDRTVAQGAKVPVVLARIPTR